MRRICVYCGSSFGSNPAFREAASDLGRLCARSGIGIVYGGGSIGLMGAVADAALAASGEVIGVIPRKLVELEKEHRGLTQLIEVDTMHDRKRVMMEHADGFITLPGGYGTMEELFEVVAWLQLGFHSKPVGLLNVAAFYDPLLLLLENMVKNELLNPECYSLLIVDTSMDALLERMSAYVAPDASKWLA